MSKVQTDNNEKAIGVIAQVDEEIQNLSIKVKCDQISQKPSYAHNGKEWFSSPMGSSITKLITRTSMPKVDR